MEWNMESISLSSCGFLCDRTYVWKGILYPQWTHSFILKLFQIYIYFSYKLYHKHYCALTNTTDGDLGVELDHVHGGY